MSVIRRLTNLARGYARTLGSDTARPEEPELDRAPSEASEEPAPAAEEEDPPAPSRREPPKPKKRTL